VARAKRTERAEARRRYRVATEGAPDGDAVVEAPAIPAAAVPRDQRDRRPSGSAPGAPPPPRPSFLTSLRAAALIPGAIILGTTAAMLIPTVAANQFVVLAGNVILQPPPMIIAFLAGMLAPRAAWLMGGLAGLASGLAYVLVVSVNTDVLVTPLGFTYLVTGAQKLAYAQNVLITAPVFGIAVGAFAGFYRRFLNMSAPQRQAGRKR
jgi:hypothetical protein